MLPLDSIQIVAPSTLSEGAFICALEHHRKPIIIGTIGDSAVAVYLDGGVFFEEVYDGAGSAIVVRDYKIVVDPYSIYPISAVSNRFGSLVVSAGNLLICAQGNRGYSYANVKIGKSDVTELHGSYCFTRWKVVVDAGDEIVTLLERLPDGTIIGPA